MLCDGGVVDDFLLCRALAVARHQRKNVLQDFVVVGFKWQYFLVGFKDGDGADKY